MLLTPSGQTGHSTRPFTSRSRGCESSGRLPPTGLFPANLGPLARAQRNHIFGYAATNTSTHHASTVRPCVRSAQNLLRSTNRPHALSRSRINHWLHVVSYKCLVQRPGLMLDHIQRLLVHLSGIVRVYAVEAVLLQVICSQTDAKANREHAHPASRDQTLQTLSGTLPVHQLVPSYCPADS